MDYPKERILGIDVVPFTTIKDVVACVESKLPLFSVNAEILMHSDKAFKRIINKGIAYPDGIGVVKVLHKRGYKDVIKIPGCELWLELIRCYPTASFYLVGSTDTVINETVQKLRKDFPGLNISGYRNGFLGKEDIAQLKEDLELKKPDFVFIAMGVPKQEFLINELYEIHPTTYLGLGGSFDVYSGLVERAPRWWIEHNLEFLYRLIKNPKRAKRQLKLLKFLYLYWRNKV